MEGQDQRTEIAQLRQWVDWLNWRVGELERQGAAQAQEAIQPQQSAQAPQPIQPPPVYVPPQVQPEPLYYPPASQPAAYTAQPQTGAGGYPASAQGPARQPRQRKPFSLEDLLSPQRLAWAGGVMLLAGIGFLVSWGIHKGWITPTMRIVAAAITSVGLGVGALVLRERGDEGDGPKAMAAVSVSGTYATLTAACQMYDMIPSPALALGLAAATAVAGVFFALRWNSEMLGGLALLGALLAPVLVDVPNNGEVFGFVIVAYTGAMVVCAARGWRTVTLLAGLIGIPMSLDGISNVDSVTVSVIDLTLLWAATQIGAFSFSPNSADRVLLAAMKSLSTIVLASAGAGLLYDQSHDAANGWLCGLAVAHVLLAVIGQRLPTTGERADVETSSRGLAHNIRERLSLLRRVIEVDWILAGGLSTVAISQILSGPSVAVAWCVQAAMIAWFTHPRRSVTTRAIARIGAGLQLGLAAIHILNIDAVPHLLELQARSLSSTGTLNSVLAIVAFIAASAVWMWRDRSPEGKINAAQTVPFAAITAATAYLAAVLLDGVELVGAFAAMSALAMLLTPKSNVSWTAMLVRFGGMTMLALAVSHTLIYEATPDMLTHHVDAIATAKLTDASIAISAVMAAAAVWLCLMPSEPDKRQENLAVPFGLVALGAAYLAAFWLDGAALVFVICGLAAATLALTPPSLIRLGQGGSLALISIAVLHTLGHEAPPIEALRDGVPDILDAAVALAGIAVAVALHAGGASRRIRTAALGGAALTLVYLGSAAIVFAFAPDPAQAHDNFEIGKIGSAQTGQALLSAFWALVAFASAVVGLRLRVKELRIAGLSLLVVATGKILLFDLSELDVAYRTISFIVVGAVLLAAAFAFQRLKRDDPDAADQPDADSVV
ncbi:MAG: DUF2339 domain-containing protein [Actinobacteria bacterium]|nr:DUF2339 domain-containing protein [Actinomycetota bacterium]